MRTSVDDGPACPVCGTASARSAVLEPGALAAALEEFVGAPVPATVQLGRYTMCRCPACALEFAEPMRPADDAFYAWLGREHRYYEQQRWEWDRVEALVALAPKPVRVLELGAGDGRFLKRLQALGAEVCAIERSPAAVAALRNAGFEAHSQDDASTALGARRFDYVLAFHVVEHVTDPVALVRSMLTWTSPGRVLFSVPYSPMYFESHWFDPLNHPPHHLTRWNRSSLERLAGAVGARAELWMPRAHSALNRARYALAIECLGPRWYRSPRRWRALPALHPRKFLAELALQLRRESVRGAPAADVVLVELLHGGP